MEGMEQTKRRFQSGRHPVDSMVVEGGVGLVPGDLLSGDTFGLVVMGLDRRPWGEPGSTIAPGSAAGRKRECSGRPRAAGGECDVRRDSPDGRMRH